MRGLGGLGRLSKRSLAARQAISSVILLRVSLGHRRLAGWRVALIAQLLRDDHRLRLLARLCWKRRVHNPLGRLCGIQIDDLLRHLM